MNREGRVMMRGSTANRNPYSAVLLDLSEQRKLHEEITGQGCGYHEIDLRGGIVRYGAPFGEEWGMSEPREMLESLNSLVGLAPWQVRLGHGSFVTMDFGARVPDDDKERGEWHLWIYCAAWRIDSATDVLAGSEDPREVITAALEPLEGAELCAVTVATPSLGLELDFGERVFRVFPVNASDAEHWMLDTPNGAGRAPISKGARWGHEE